MEERRASRVGGLGLELMGRLLSPGGNKISAGKKWQRQAKGLQD